MPRAWRRFWRVGLATWLADAVVVGTLLLWHVIGAISSDDGYNLTIARVSGQAGYAANYYRYYGATEAPFDWYQSVLAQLTTVSTAGVWMRLPALLAAIATWLLLSRWVIPRLGRRLASNRVAVWTAGAVFLAGWLPFNNGLRPEPLIAFGALLTWVLVEYAIGSRRLWPAAAAVIVAMFSVTLAPQGLIAVAPLLVGARAIATIIRDRRAEEGWAGLLAPLAALASSASLIFVIVFHDQTLATVAESARIKYSVGPTIAWYQDFLRYYFLTVEDSADGSLTRRFSVLVLLLCLLGMIAVLLRRGSLPGMASGPVWRLIGACAVGLLLLTFTPTKWAVQFGAFAGIGGALGAVTAFTFSRVGLHNRRNLALYVTALLFILAWATSGINGWFYVGNYGVPWFDKQPVIASHPVTTMFLALAIITGLLAGWLHFRLDYTGHTEVANNRRNRVLASTPLLVVATIVVLLEVASMAKGAAARYPAYTTAKANAEAIASGLSDTSCAMADDVLVEPDTNAGTLQPVPGQRFGPDGPLGGSDPVGFSPNGVSDSLDPPEPVTANPGTVNSPGSPNKPNAGVGFAAGTGGGYGPVGVNGSRVFLPYGLDPARTPVMGSYGENTQAAKATSAWYQLPPRTPDRPLVSVVAAGAIWSYDEEHNFNYGQSLKLEWGVQQARRHLPGAGPGAAHRHGARTEGLAKPALPAGVGAAGGERRAHRRRRPEPELRPVVRVHAAPRPRPAERPAVPRQPDAGADGHRHRGELPVPAAVLRAPRRRRASAVPNPPQLQAGSGVVQPMAGGTGRRPVPVHPGPAAHVHRADLPPRRLVPRLGLDRTLRPGRTRAGRPGGRRRPGVQAGVRLEPSRSDQGAPVTAPAIKDVRVIRWVAIVAGFIGFLFSVLTPLLPVVQTTATLNWPQAGQLTNVTAPLITETPVSMTATVPCDVIRDMPPAGGLVLGTAPADGKEAALNALFVNVNSTRVDITDRNVVVASVPRTRVASPDCQRIEITSTEAGTFATFVGLSGGHATARTCAAGSPIRTCGRRSSASSPT